MALFASFCPTHNEKKAFQFSAKTRSGATRYATRYTTRYTTRYATRYTTRYATRYTTRYAIRPLRFNQPKQYSAYVAPFASLNPLTCDSDSKASLPIG